MSVGGEIDGEKGESVFRRDARVIIIAVGGLDGVDVRASVMSSMFVGEPSIIVRFGVGVSVVGFRIRAVTWWFWVRAWDITIFPVLPEPPRMRKCISMFGFVGVGSKGRGEVVWLFGVGLN